MAASRNAIKPSSKWFQTRSKAFIDNFSSVGSEGPGQSNRTALTQMPRCRWIRPPGGRSTLLVGCVGGLDQVGTDFAFELGPYRLHGVTPHAALLWGQG